MCWKLFYVFLTLTGGIDRDTDQRVEICSAVVKEAEFQGVDPIIAVSVAWIENRFTNETNPDSGASGPLQILPHYWCPNKDGVWSKHRADGVLKGCDTLEQGIFALAYYLNTRKTVRQAIADYGYKKPKSVYVRHTLKLISCAKNPSRSSCKRKMR